MAKKTKYPKDSDQTPVVYREARFDLDSANDEERSIDIVLASDTPVQTVDMKRMRMIDEVLDMDGVDLPRQLPLLDSHDRSSVRGVIGSIRNLERVGGELRGRAYFSRKNEDIYESYRDGILTDFSVGARRLESVMSRDGNTRTVKRWRPFEGSAVVVGADPTAKAMSPALRAYFDPEDFLEHAMSTKLHDALVKRGMPADLEGQDVVEWVESNLKPEAKEPEQAQRDYTDLLDAVKADKSVVEAIKRSAAGNDNVDREEVAREVLERYESINEMCRKHKVTEKQRKEWLNSDISPDTVARKILEMNANGVPIGGGVEVTVDRREKFWNAAVDGLTQRVCRGMVNPEKALESARERLDSDAITRNESLVKSFTKPSEGYDIFRASTLSDFARAYLEEAGIDCKRMTREQICRQALRHRGLFDGIERSDGAYHTTGSFSNLMLDAANKTLLAAYDEAPTTYQMWVRQAPSASDFKNLNRIRFGELADPEVVPENFPYPEKSTSDAKETYAVNKYGELFSISWEAVVNDDLNAISRIPAMQGAAMRRKINKVCYGVLTDNAALSDGVALFHSSSHGANLDANALAVTALNTGYTVMRTQTGLSGSGTPLNISPRYLIVPAALEATAYQIIGSIADPSNTAGSTEDASRPNYNSGTLNLYGPNGPRRLVVVSDAQLDGTSTTGWYMAADPMVVDTVELTFLQGYESPVLSREEGFEVDSIKYKITQVFAAAAIDYRGLYQGNS